MTLSKDVTFEKADRGAWKHEAVAILSEICETL